MKIRTLTIPEAFSGWNMPQTINAADPIQLVSPAEIARVGAPSINHGLDVALPIQVMETTVPVIHFFGFKITPTHLLIGITLVAVGVAIGIMITRPEKVKKEDKRFTPFPALLPGS